MKKYEEGFYWVALDDCEDWTIAHRFNNKWYVIGIEENIPDDEIEIGEFISPERPYKSARNNP